MGDREVSLVHTVTKHTHTQHAFGATDAKIDSILYPRVADSASNVRPSL